MKLLADQKNLFVCFTSHQPKLKTFQGFSYLCDLRQNKHILRKESLTQLTLRCYYQCIIWDQDLQTRVCLSNQEGYVMKLQTRHTFMNLVKCNCTKSSQRPGQCICKRPSCIIQLYLRTRWIMMMFAKIRKLVTSPLWIQAMSKNRLFCFSLLLLLICSAKQWTDSYAI